MSYRQPGFMISHSAADLTISDVDGLAVSPAVTDAGKRALIDSRATELCAMVSNAASTGIYYDFGGTTQAGDITTAIVPAGHTLGGEDITVFSGASVGASVVRYSETVPAGSAVIDCDFTERTADQVWGINITSSVAATTYYIGEFWIGKRVDLSSDAHVQPGFELEYLHTIREDVIGGREVALELVPPRRKFSLDVRWILPTSADYTILEEIVRLGRARPFWYWPPDDDTPGPYLVSLDAAPKRVQESIAPQGQIAYRIGLEMVEQTA